MKPRADFHEGARLVSFDVYENLEVKRAESYGGLYGWNMAKTLEAKGAREKGFVDHGGMDGYWRMEKGEQFTDAAIRVGRHIFEMLNIRIEADAVIPKGRLLSLFVVYKLTRVECGRGTIRFDDYLRGKHGLPVADTGLIGKVL